MKYCHTLSGPVYKVFLVEGGGGGGTGLFSQTVAGTVEPKWNMDPALDITSYI